MSRAVPLANLTTGTTLRPTQVSALPSSRSLHTEAKSPPPQAIWHYLQISDALDREFTRALSKLTPVIAWQPAMSLLGLFRGGPVSEREQNLATPQLRIRHFPLQKGYARAPFSWANKITDQLMARLLRQSVNPRWTPLVCSTPYHAALAERWEGPIVYYLTDLMARYVGADRALVRALDTRMCSVATLVCPNSQRLANYLMSEAGCPPEKISITPNATRESNLLPHPPAGPAELPSDAQGLARPIAGVLGNLAGNLDWPLLKGLVERTPGFSWLFVGPSEMRIENRAERQARDAVLAMGSRVRFVGRKPYHELAMYARALDVAVLPYFRREPTFSGSSTRFYEHLAACRPMLATRGFEELLHKEPLLQLFDTAEEGATVLDHLKLSRFDDGQAQARWQASLQGTWEVRAASMYRELKQRWKERADGEPLLNRSLADQNVPAHF